MDIRNPNAIPMSINLNVPGDVELDIGGGPLGAGTDSTFVLAAGGSQTYRVRKDINGTNSTVTADWTVGLYSSSLSAIAITDDYP